ncbi:MAG: adenylosuccinate lyase [Spirochaetales bacterium]|jgi:adenylosuccinate lyase|nr:adenylosuccinate lyase [Spirochaetales bacterium]
MESQNQTNRSIYRNISPLDHRYYLSNKQAFDELAEYLSEDANIRYLLRAEMALLKTHLAQSSGGETLPDIENAVSPAEVYEEEEKTQHNIRALVNVMKRYLPENLRNLVHAGATSADILDTANSLRIRDAVRKVVLPRLAGLLALLAGFAEKHAETPQVGRTHGQHAVPITAGYWMAEFVARLGKSFEEIDRLSKNLRGKLSGAVGAYNATSLMVADPQHFEKTFCGFLGIEPSEYSHQLVEPEYLLRLLLEINTAFGIIANLADDLRNLQRSEINEIREHFGADQVGSSTMPQKRNPWNSEHVKSLWKAFSPRVMSFYMDQISEHQRDLTNSASSRFVSEYIAGFLAAVCRMTKVVKSLNINEENLKRNLAAGGDMVLAEAAYILLARSGESEGHEKIRRATLAAEQGGTTLCEELKKDSSLWNSIEKSLASSIGVKAETFFSKPELYRGLAAEKARLLARKYAQSVKNFEEALK